MITTDIVDGVIYASKEDWSSNGPYLEFTFTTSTTTTTTVTTTTDSSTPTTTTTDNSSLITSSVMTPVIIGNNHKEATALTEIVNTTVISSSFRMTLIAIETRGNTIPGDGSTGRYNTVDVVPSLEEKEGSSIIEHLLRVYREVLSIPPMDISLTFEEELVVEDVVLRESSSSSGVIRKCVFRVMGK